MKILKLIIFLSITIVFSCDKIDNPLKPVDDSTCGDGNGIVPIRKILVEDYTAHKCVFCPLAAEDLEDIKDKYCDHIISISVHVGYLAEPDADYPEDYRSDVGNELDEYYNISSSLPKGLINRTEYEGSIILSPNSWEAFVNTLYSSKPQIDISIKTSYDEATKKITAQITAEYLSDINYNMNLGLYVTEDSIIGPQKFVGDPHVIENYVNRHVLRKGLNGAFGEPFASSAKFGQIIEKSFTFEANEGWDINHVEVVAFISNTETKEIIQAESETVIK